MSTDTLETLQQVNVSLRSALLRLCPEQRHCLTIRREDLSDLLSEILRAAECMRDLPTHSDAAAVQQASLEYRNHLEELKRVLPDLHGRLLAEKSRLETAQTHVAAAAAWARASEKRL